MNFSWVPFYKELAKKLIPYAGRSGELVQIAETSLESLGFSIDWLQDKNAIGKKQKLSEIDPFTFFAVFNRKMKKDNRLALASLFSLACIRHGKPFSG